jgi:hypothetical protein
MSENQGFDDQFNDGLFHMSLNNSRLERPHLWPKSVSEMRRHTFYGGQGMTKDHDTNHNTYVVRHPTKGEWQYHHGRHGWIWVDT